MLLDRDDRANIGLIARFQMADAARPDCDKALDAAGIPLDEGLNLPRFR
jgi:hypothetical protein